MCVGDGTNERIQLGGEEHQVNGVWAICRDVGHQLLSCNGSRSYWKGDFLVSGSAKCCSFCFLRRWFSIFTQIKLFEWPTFGTQREIQHMF